MHPLFIEPELEFIQLVIVLYGQIRQLFFFAQDMGPDCCKQDPEECLNFKLRNDNVVVEVKNKEDDLQERTALLVVETFSLKNTGMRTYTSDERLKLLQREMNLLYKQLEKVHKNPESKVAMRTAYSLLRRESAFAAFKRCYVREHAAEYPQLQKYVALDT